MSLLQLIEASKSYPEQEIFSNVFLQIQKQDRIGLIGANGMGKSTLVKIFTEEEFLDTGQLMTSNDLDIGYLQQNLGVISENTLYQEMLSVYEELFVLEENLEKLEEQMATTTGQNLDKIMNKYSRLRKEFESKEGYRYESKIKGVLRGLGFSDLDFDKEISNFSGGQKTRVALAKLLLQEPNLLLLDEPTNHLDLEAKEWLEDYLQSYPGAVVIISHDRYLLKNLVNRIWELEKGRLEEYKGNYSYYLKEKKHRLLTWQREYEQQQKKIKEMKAFIRKYKAGIKSKQARGRQKKLDRMNKIPPPPKLAEPEIEFSSKNITVEEILAVKNLSKSYQDELILEEISFRLYRGEKVALVGPNGSGKTTCFKLLTALEEPDSGVIRTAKGVKIGYYDQEHKNLTAEYNLIEELQKVKNMTDGQARDILAKFLFKEDDVFKSVETLSGGEKARLSLAKLSLQDCNLLLLDEPTNHLDIKSKELLQKALQNYSGTILMISHDRYLLDDLADKIFALQDDKLVEYKGNYSDYKQEYEKMLAQQRKQEKNKSAKRNNQKSNKQSQVQKKEEQLENLETKILELETKIEKLEDKLNTSNLEEENLMDLTSEYQQLQEKLETYYQQWEEVV